ncbi:BBE domain-containing protein [Konateibacter massiliensis]|uniref:BBE domain-containing protein n=1 Tax=Konateibacter massiliensis TaxID=2002841 RepID=UPI001F1D5B84|nr:BBE domain-containing protein [Konateibacter massiliensis]
MTFALPSKVNYVTLIEIDYLDVDSREQEKFLSIWQEWLKTADPRITLISRIYNSIDDGLGMLVRGIFYGEPQEAEQIMADFLALSGADYNIEYMTFLEAVTIIGSAYPSFEKFQSVSRFVLRDFTCVERAELAGLIRERPQGSVFAGISMYALGGRVSEVGTNDTAFFYRHANYIIWLETIWEDYRYAQENREWIDSRFPYVEAITTGSYVNFPYGKLPDYLEEYYGNHASILMKIKTKYDPCNIFSFPQSIGKSVCGDDTADASYRIPPNSEEGTIEKSGDTNYRGFRYVSKRI